MRVFGLGFTNPVGIRSVGRVSVFGLRWCVWCKWGVVRVWRGGVGWCYVCVSCGVRILSVDGRSRYLCIVLGGYPRILGVHSVQYRVAPYGYLPPTMYLFMADIAYPYLFVYGCRTWICLDITRFF